VRRLGVFLMPAVLVAPLMYARLCSNRQVLMAAGSFLGLGRLA
jgi:hypothetical protein